MIGAEAVGLPVAWINRSNGLFDALGKRPPLIVETLVELANELV